MKKGAIVETSQIHRRQFQTFCEEGSGPEAYYFAEDVFTFSGPSGYDAFGGWSKDPRGQLHKGFVKCCVVSANLESLAASLPWQVNKATSVRYKDLCAILRTKKLLFGAEE